MRNGLFIIGLIAVAVGVAAGSFPITGHVVPSLGGLSFDILGTVGTEVEVPCGSVFAPATVKEASGPLDDLVRGSQAALTDCDELLAERQQTVAIALVSGGLLMVVALALTALVGLGRGIKWFFR